MNEYSGGALLAAQLTIVLYLLSPVVSMELWQTLARRWRLHRSRAQEKRSRKSKEKLKRYWELDMTKFK